MELVVTTGAKDVQRQIVITNKPTSKFLLNCVCKIFFFLFLVSPVVETVVWSA